MLIIVGVAYRSFNLEGPSTMKIALILLLCACLLSGVAGVPARKKTRRASVWDSDTSDGGSEASDSSSGGETEEEGQLGPTPGVPAAAAVPGVLVPAASDIEAPAVAPAHAPAPATSYSLAEGGNRPLYLTGLPDWLTIDLTTDSVSLHRRWANLKSCCGGNFRTPSGSLNPALLRLVAASKNRKLFDIVVTEAVEMEMRRRRRDAMRRLDDRLRERYERHIRSSGANGFSKVVAEAAWEPLKDEMMENLLKRIDADETDFRKLIWAAVIALLGSTSSCQKPAAKRRRDHDDDDEGDDAAGSGSSDYTSHSCGGRGRAATA